VILDVREAARVLGMSEEQVYELATKRVLPSYVIDEQLRFNKVELLEWAQKRRRRIDTGMFRRPTVTGPTLSGSLTRGGIHRDVVAKDAHEALLALVKLLPLPPSVDREAVTSLFVSRSGSVTADAGIAIPHARSPVVLPMDDAVVSLAFFKEPVDMKAHDGRPVRMAFAIFSPTVRSHLHLLARLSGALSDEAFNASLEPRASDEAILGRLRALEAKEAER
jgi:PTS system nitrogen regulatory IIA component